MLYGHPPSGSPGKRQYDVDYILPSLCVSIDGDGRRKPPEGCPCPPYFQDRPEEDVPENWQGEDDIKVEVEEEKIGGDHPWKSEVEEDVPAGR
ncbi:hypothetical protein GDO78_018352 [Eleutherodactylus coqui]|uniref:Uncharacterized protein n=1 Tax=Eleutherodactylus coqui TaxID=57060 RepID=A0A8J6BDJ1_ELECQ|nr:hypothetical protein GDO78_018352 [Eleutherodactylus coqui]